MLALLWPSTLLIYGVGCALSQSLMSLGGTLAVLLFVGESLDALRTGSWREARGLERAGWAVGLAWTTFLVARLLLAPPSPNFEHALGALPLFIIPSLALFPKARARAAAALPKVVLWTGVAYAVSACFGTVQVLFLGERSAFGFLRNPIFFAYNLLAALVFFTVWAQSKDRRYWALLGLLSIALLLSASRVAALVGFGFLAFYAVPRAYRRIGMRPILLGLALLVGLGTWQYSTNKYWRSKLRQGLRIQTSQSLKGRKVVWKHNWELFLEHPWTGVGFENNALDTSSTAYRRWRHMWPPGLSIYAHSIYFQALAESGLLGSALWGSQLVTLGLALPPTRPLLAVLLLGGSTENVFNNSKAAHAFFFFLLLLGLMRRASTENDLRLHNQKRLEAPSLRI